MTSYRTFVFYPAWQWKDAEVVAELPEELSQRPVADFGASTTVGEPQPWSFDEHGYMSDGAAIRSGVPRLVKLKNVAVQRMCMEQQRYHVLLADGICADETYHSGAWIAPRIGEGGASTVTTWNKNEITAPFYIIDEEPVGAVVDKPTVLISHKWSGNHAHGLLETMSRFWCADQWPADAQLLWENTSLTQVEAHKLFKSKYPTFAQPANRTLYKELWLPGFLCPYGTSPRQIEYLRRTLQIETAPRPQFERIYISRGDADERRVLNEPELTKALEARGFKPVILTNMAMRDQVATFKSARQIVMPHGAGGANLLFTEPGAKVVELLPASYTHPMYGYIAKWSGHWYGRIVCPETGDRHDMTVDIGQVLEALDA